MDGKTQARIKAEIKKVREDPDYLSPICLRCGMEIGKPVVIAVMFGIPFTGKDVVCYDYEDLLCEDCMDLEIVEQAKELGEWEEVD